jgi:DNA polymerase (family 10)
MYEAGAWVLLESALADLPADLRWLFESGAVAVGQLRRLNDALGIATQGELAAAVEAGTIRAVPGLGEDVEGAIRGALPGLRRAIPRIPLGHAVAIVEPLLDCLRAVRQVRWASLTGSLRRASETVGDLELVAAADDAAPAIEALVQDPDVVRVLHRSDRRLVVLLDRVQVSVRFPPLDAAGTALLQSTGSAAHLAQLARLARAQHVEIVPAPREEDTYERLGLPYIAPELREGDDELSAAQAGTLPALVSRDQIRGDLHMHSDWSDGRDSIESMVSACRALRYEYIAITDHSQRSAASRNLSFDAVQRQADEIAALRERYPEIVILHGCEVDIMPDGRLDFADRVLERFDIVLASLHDPAGHSSEQLQKRYESAMHHPLVTLITHPTNRALPYKRGYDLDYGRLFATAVETETAVEIDGAPAHLDLNGTLARRAIAAGATVAIDSDCHRAEMLDRQMRLGIVTARRGWVEARHVLNTRSIGDVQAFIGRKRASR